MDNIKKNKKNIVNLLNKIYAIDGVISANIVGSFAQNKKLNDIGDLDLVIISKKISKEIYSKCKLVVKKHNFNTKKKVKINDTFGPLKYNKNVYFTVHLMIYDIKGHVEHVIKSPFTCFDWERKNISIGLKLKDIYNVNNLQLIDFFYSRRAITKYYKDLKSHQISIYSYIFKKNNYQIKSYYKNLDKLNILNYSKHIFSQNVNNFYKFLKQKNVKLNKKNEEIFLITQNFDKKFIKQIHRLLKNKDSEILRIIKKFLDMFYKRLKSYKKNTSSVTFIRHAKTKNNDGSFLGKNDIGILRPKKKFNKKYGRIFSSPLKRAIQTAKLFQSNKKIKLNNNLKEINYGKADGLNFSQLKDKFPSIIKGWNNKKDVRFPSGENNKMVLSRVNHFTNTLISLDQKNISTNYLVVTHNVFLRCLIGKFFNIEMSDWFKINIDHLKELNFIILNGKLIPNIERKSLKKILYFKINELSSINKT